MNQPWTNAPIRNEHLHLGVFEARLGLSGKAEIYDIRATLYRHVHLVQLDVCKPDIGWEVLAFVDHKHETAELVVLPEYTTVRSNRDTKQHLLNQTTALLPKPPARRPRSELNGIGAACLCRPGNGRLRGEWRGRPGHVVEPDDR